MDKIIKAPDRLRVIEKIEEYESKGLFHLDVEDDPPWKPLDHKKVNFLRKGLWAKTKRFIAYRFGRAYFKSLLRKREVIFAGVNGLENIKDFRDGAIITCNHMHQFDNYAVLFGFEHNYSKWGFRIWKVVREGNFSFPGTLGFIMRNCDTLPVNERENQNIKLTVECMKAIRVLLEKKQKVLIYPEQGMWWNYKKPRPLKKGAFLFASKFNSPIIPCFLTLKDSDKIGKDGFPVQEITLNISSLIYPDAKLSVAENTEIMREKNFEVWKEVYQKTYGEELSYAGKSYKDFQVSDD